VKRRTATWLFAAVVASVAAYVLLPESEVSAVRGVLERAARTVRHPTGPERHVLQAELAITFAPDAVVSIPEHTPILRAGAALVPIIERARSRYTRMDLALGEVTVRVAESGREALAQADAVLTLAGSGRLVQDARHVTVKLAKAGEGWRVTAIDVAPRTYAEPEARP
jgi:hypothetical protein